MILYMAEQPTVLVYGTMCAYRAGAGAHTHTQLHGLSIIVILYGKYRHWKAHLSKCSDY